MIRQQQYRPVFLEIRLIKLQFFEIRIYYPADVPGKEHVDNFVLAGFKHWLVLVGCWLCVVLLVVGDCRSNSSNNKQLTTNIEFCL